MKKKFFVLAVALLSLFACSKDNHTPPSLNVPEEPEPPTNPITPGRNVVVWVDARSNVFGTYGKFSSKTEIVNILDRLEDCGVTGLVIDVKPSSGYTMYNSAYTKEWTSYDGKTKPADYVEFLISEAKKRKMKTYLSIVTFVEGNTGGVGYVWDNPEFKEKYESIVVKDTQGTLGRISTTGKSVFVNPAHPEVQERVLNLLKEMVGKFDMDGIILDYCRYTDINADFSDFSKTKFIEFLRTKYNDTQASSMNFPTDIVSSWRESSGQLLPATTGKYYKQWLVFRASVIQDFIKKARAAVKSVKSNVSFGVYVGAWYTTYYQVGVNWASKEYDPFQDFNVRFDWAYPGYGETGYLEELDLLMTGNYFTQIMLSENPATASMKYHWWSIEGSLNGIEYITKNKKPIYGSLDVGNVNYASKSEISRAIKYILSRTSGGIMLFDVVHMYAPQYNYLKQELFDAIKEGVKNQ
ncbi:family 10 glycosylhydrolase [Sphingobacterium thermophilum]|uniref:Glycosyl hydrolase-like 10 domain-containing protein n=2 Tax=Sphingobacterium TaxID=28453 RepID=A0ABP8R1G6_9SPHI